MQLDADHAVLDQMRKRRALAAIRVVAPEARRRNRAARRSRARTFRAPPPIRRCVSWKASHISRRQERARRYSATEAVYGACGESPNPPSHSGWLLEKAERAHHRFVLVDTRTHVDQFEEPPGPQRAARAEAAAVRERPRCWLPWRCRPAASEHGEALGDRRRYILPFQNDRRRPLIDLIHSVKPCRALRAPLKQVKSRWQCALIRPGSSVLAPKSATASPGWAVSSEAGPTATTSEPSTRTAPLEKSVARLIGRTTSARYNIEMRLPIS